MRSWTHALRPQILFVALVFVVLSFAGFGMAHAQNADQRCFPETGQCISGRIRSFWEQNGGLPVFGFPITSQRPETTREGTFTSQWFERTRLELHPENAAPYDVLLARAGDLRLQQQNRDWFSFPKADPATRNRSDCHYFAETGHSVCGLMWQTYRRYGLRFAGQNNVTFEESLALFGMPLSQPQFETNSSGFTVLTQWFERARFEYLPENAPPFNILFGRLGAEVLDEYLVPAPTPTAAPPTATPGAGPNGCTLSMTFGSDRAVPNGSTLAPGAAFTRIWRVRNTGTCYWENYRLVFSRGDQMGGPASVRVPQTEPGASVDISVPLVAPTSPGTYRGFWVMQASNGVTFDGLVVEITVAAAPTATPTAAPVAPTTEPPAPTEAPVAPTAVPPAPTAEPPAPTAAPPASSLVGPTWAWQTTKMNDGAVVNVADPSRYTIQFLADGTLAVRADCNQIGGSYQTSGNTLSLMLGPGTLVACAADSQADRFVQDLGSINGYLFDGADLVLELKFDSGTLRFARLP